MTQFVGRMNMDSESLMKLEAISPTSEAVIVTRRGSWPILELKDGEFVRPCRVGISCQKDE